MLGAPKCGTTALSTYLREHSNVLFSNPKEPLHFCTDLQPSLYASTDEYIATCFPDKESFAAVGEGSPMYLYSKVAVKNILQHNPKAKFIVMVRNPVSLFVSLYNHLHASGQDMAPNPEVAWQQQVPADGEVSDGAYLRKYADVCSLGQQLSYLYEQVPSEQVHVIVFDDLKHDTRSVYVATLDFLGIPDDGRTVFKKVNVSRATGNLLMRKLYRAWLRFRSATGIALGLGNTVIVQKLFFGKKKNISPEFKKELQNYFRADVALLAKLINRDLSHWVN